MKRRGLLRELCAASPVTDFTVEDYTLRHFERQIQDSGWSTGNTAATPAPITKTYSGDRSFEELVNEVAADFGVCVTIDEAELRVAFSDCP